MSVVCKMQCHGIKGTPNAEACTTAQLSFGAVWEGSTEQQQASENAIFGKWTPSGSISLNIANPAAVEFFETGKKYYVTFTEAPD